MSWAGVDAIRFHDSLLSATDVANLDSEQSLPEHHGGFRTSPVPLGRYARPRRTPRKSLIVVLPDNHRVSPDLVSEHLAAEGDSEMIDVILAAAGRPSSLAGLHRRVRDLKILLAPAGTSEGDLRELAMDQVPGDIVTLLSGIPS